MPARTYVVTGAASGIGKSVMSVLAGKGHHAIGVDLAHSDIDADLSEADGCEAMAAAVARSSASVNAVIACAGLASPTATTVAVNYFGMVGTLEALRPLMTGADSPRAVGIASLAAIHPVDDDLVSHMLAGNRSESLARARELASDSETESLIYGSTKNAFARWVRRNAPGAQWAGAGIALNAIAPGIVLTPMTTPLLKTQWRQDIETGAPFPLNGMMEPVAPAHLLEFLASAENTHMCGQVVFIDSGAEAVLRGDSRV